MRRSAGFTLIEIAVVIAIIGFLAFMITPLVGSQISAARYRETRVKLDPIKSAVIAFVAANNRLPCPAVENLPSTDPQYGKEAATPGTCDGTTVLTGGASRGIVPWVTLGLSGEAAADAFGRFFTYAVATNQTNLVANTVPGMTGIIAVHTGTPVAPANQVNVGNLAVFVVISHGLNGYGAFNPGSGARTPFPAPPGADESENADTANIAFVDKTFSDMATNPFDDIVMWVAPRDILAALGPSGVKTSQGAMSEKFAAIKAALLSHLTADNAPPPAAITRVHARRMPCPDVDAIPDGNGDCGAGTTGGVPWIDLSLPATTALDSWGRPIRYTLNTPLMKNATTDTAGVYANVDSTYQVVLKSDGPDGIANNADDVTLTIKAREFSAALLAAGVTVDP